MSARSDAPVVVSDETFAEQSAALAAGEPLVLDEEIEIIVPTADDEVEVVVEAPKAKAKAVKPKKLLTVHRHWLIDIARHAKSLGIHEGQKLVGTVRKKKGKKVLELVFVD